MRYSELKEIRALHSFTVALILLITITIPLSNLYAQDDIEITANNIAEGHFNNAINNVCLKSFSEDSALIKLFPGHFYKIVQYGDTFTFEAWNCSSLKQKEFAGKWGSQDFPDTFPRQSGNDTRVIGSIKYTGGNGRDYIMLATTTTQLSDLVLTGRFSCGILGIAVFEYYNNMWILKAFNPSITCTGSYSKAPMPELLRSEKRAFACSVTSSNGGPGGPYYDETYIIGLTQPTLHVLLQNDLTGRAQGGKTEWKTEITTALDTSNTLPAVVLNIKGYCDISELKAGNDKRFLKILFDGANEHYKHFHFTIKESYNFINGAYKQITRKVSIRE